ncbi:hypothetical protein I79_004624 [Cricetulus griseus]|uniref:Uncharacterized protein n=1 Tax=Cricetulus griseus TaxID=10029 RepID=G3H318_CRIGR|nr:hypothetical protein I79_004624 [Cricetulus griseus]
MPCSVYHEGKSGQELKQRHCGTMFTGLFLYTTQGHLPSGGIVCSELGPPTSIKKLPHIDVPRPMQRRKFIS